MPSEVGLLGGMGCAASTGRQPAEKGRIRTTLGSKGNKQEHYYGLEAKVSNDHYASMLYEVRANKC